MSTIRNNLKSVLDRIQVAIDQRPADIPKSPVRLIVVTKTKHADTILELYSAGHRDFGENYVQELLEKSNNPSVISSCPDIRWHFIGHLQRNKVKKLLSSVPGLSCVQTVDSRELALELHKQLSASGATRSQLDVFLQVNTSGEDQKSGCEPSELCALADAVSSECEGSLRVAGLMCIGKYPPENTAQFDQAAWDACAALDFQKLIDARNRLAAHLQLDAQSIALSMGMSTDFECAVRMGSSVVRVGSLIVGSR